MLPDSAAAQSVGGDDNDVQCRATCVGPDDSSVTCFTPKSEVSLAVPMTAVSLTHKISCYCKRALHKAILQYGLFDALSMMTDAHNTDGDGDLCAQFSRQWVIAQGLFVLTAIAVRVSPKLVILFLYERVRLVVRFMRYQRLLTQVPWLNYVAKTTIRILSRFERHETITQESVSITRKVFVLQCLNTGIVFALVNARLPHNLSSPLPGTGVLEARTCPTFPLAVSTAMFTCAEMHLCAPRVCVVCPAIYVVVLSRWWCWPGRV